MRTVLVAMIFALSGCASQILESYVGKSVNEPILDYGPPTHVLELDNHTRAYQWKVDASGAMPIYTPTSATAYGPSGVTTVTGSTTTWVPYSNTCIYTLLAQPNGKDWVVTGYRKPSLDCE
ncbi:hypothetical protein [Paenirhodobacter sp. CAU 1674]|jgi:hypothetical protein|uniref:hypothetical protein n=1 Tax=Paenirhodobacter sp. CAU 1674 TaxID=3032596 RepID=UPI0023DBCA9D|nr:hypothetical protein [Paenirhodobacter sp. CAU 1674]MDF2143091.1 hypothetical protein [Paenirhodobacter sp. CAU 1674]